MLYEPITYDHMFHMGKPVLPFRRYREETSLGEAHQGIPNSDSCPIFLVQSLVVRLLPALRPARVRRPWLVRFERSSPPRITMGGLARVHHMC